MTRSIAVYIGGLFVLPAILLLAKTRALLERAS